MLARQRLPDGQAPGERAEDRRNDVQGQREDDPAPDDEAERVHDAPPLRPSPPEQRGREDERDDGDCCLRPARAPDAAYRRHAARASTAGISVKLAESAASRLAMAGQA